MTTPVILSFFLMLFNWTPVSPPPCQVPEGKEETRNPSTDIVALIGEVSDPVHTPFGYHIIYAAEERERSPERSVSHMYIPDNNINSAAELIYEIYDKLEAGCSWEDVISSYNEEIRSGVVGWVGYATQFPEPFVDAVMEADPPAPFSEVLEMPYRYHIVRIDPVRTFETYGQLTEFAESELRRSQRFAPSDEILLENLRIAGNFSQELNSEDLYPFFEEFKNNANYQNTETIFTFDGNTYNSNHFFEFITEQDQQDYNIDLLLKDFIDHSVRSQLVSITRAEFPLFEHEANQILEGLMVFRFNEEFLWNAGEDAEADHEAMYMEKLREKYNVRLFPEHVGIEE